MWYVQEHNGSGWMVPGNGPFKSEREARAYVAGKRLKSPTRRYRLLKWGSDLLIEV